MGNEHLAEVEKRFNDLYLYNTLTKEKEKFETLTDGKVYIYVCGPTAFEVNGPSLHYVRMGIFFDVLKGYLKELGYDVYSAMNITDYHIDIVEKTDELKKPSSEVVEESIRKYFEDMKFLEVYDYNEYPRATEHIDGIKSLVKTLLDKGFAYRTENAIYLDVSTVEEKTGHVYGTLAGRPIRPEDIKQKKDLKGSSEKQDPRDFLLWKYQDENEEEIHKDLWFDAPELGNRKKGGPGWHSECIAMIKDVFKVEIDIHGGRIDHIIKHHHENELIQNKAAYDNGLAKTWLHTGMVTYEGKDGWDVTLRQLAEENVNDPHVIRYAFLANSYRSPMNLNKNSFGAANKKVSEIRYVVNMSKKLIETASNKQRNEDVKKLIDDANKKFKISMNNDVGTPHVIHSVNHLTEKLSKKELLNNLGAEDLKDIVNYYKSVNKALKIF